jgi:hypothetical protein
VQYGLKIATIQPHQNSTGMFAMNIAIDVEFRDKQERSSCPKLRKQTVGLHDCNDGRILGKELWRTVRLLTEYSHSHEPVSSHFLN